MGIPRLQESQPVLNQDGPQPIEFCSAKTVRFREIDGTEPKHCEAIAMLDMDVRGLRSFQDVEEETKSGVSQDGRH
jgi:hypothetical protein